MIQSFFGCLFAIAAWALALITVGNHVRRKLVTPTPTDALEDLKLQHAHDTLAVIKEHQAEREKTAATIDEMTKLYNETAEACRKAQSLVKEAIQQRDAATEACRKAQSLAREAIQQRDAVLAEFKAGGVGPS